MFDWLWKKLEFRINSLITRRIGLFYTGLVERGQIPPNTEGPAAG